MKGQGNKKKSFEAALNRLEKIVSEMEEGELSLDEMLKKFGEGMKLAQFCSKKLDEAEKKIEVLVKKEDGAFETEEFVPSEDAISGNESSEKSSGREEASDQEADEDQEPLF
jgi:exodeoxyribonuclease VII small subunit